MSLSRRETSTLRAAMVFGAIGVILLHLFGRWLNSDMPPKAQRYDLFTRNSMANYPDWVAYGNLPLNVAFSYSLLLFVLWRVYKQSRRKPTMGQEVMHMLIVGMSFVALVFGLMGSAMNGWYFGLQSALYGIGFALAMLGVIMLGWGVYWAVTNAYEAYVKWWLEPRLKRIFAPVNRWFNAEDVDAERS